MTEQADVNFMLPDGGQVRHSPRSAAVLFANALAYIDTVQPEAMRPAVRGMLTAGIETCATSRSLFGKPLGHLIIMAKALVDSATTAPAGPVDDARR